MLLVTTEKGRNRADRASNGGGQKQSSCWVLDQCRLVRLKELLSRNQRLTEAWAKPANRSGERDLRAGPKSGQQTRHGCEEKLDLGATTAEESNSSTNQDLTSGTISRAVDRSHKPRKQTKIYTRSLLAVSREQLGAWLAAVSKTRCQRPTKNWAAGVQAHDGAAARKPKPTNAASMAGASVDWRLRLCA
jgi:hypothetical protein